MGKVCPDCGYGICEFLRGCIRCCNCFKKFSPMDNPGDKHWYHSCAICNDAKKEEQKNVVITADSSNYKNEIDKSGVPDRMKKIHMAVDTAGWSSTNNYYNHAIASLWPKISVEGQAASSTASKMVKIKQAKTWKEFYSDLGQNKAKKEVKKTMYKDLKEMVEAQHVPAKYLDLFKELQKFPYNEWVEGLKKDNTCFARGYRIINYSEEKARYIDLKEPDEYKIYCLFDTMKGYNENGEKKEFIKLTEKIESPMDLLKLIAGWKEPKPPRTWKTTIKIMETVFTLTVGVIVGVIMVTVGGSL